MTREEFYESRVWSYDLSTATGFDYGRYACGFVFDGDVAIERLPGLQTVYRAVWLHEVFDTEMIDVAAGWLYDRLVAEGLI